MRSTIPRVPHLPGSRLGNDDLTVAEQDLPLFLHNEVVVVEKLDGVALTIGIELGELDVAMKTDWKGALAGRILRAARRWVRVHEDVLASLLDDGAQLYAEWLLHRLVTPYDHLPAAVIFHGKRTPDGRLVPRDEVNEALRRKNLAAVDPCFRGVIGDRPLGSLVPKRSRFGKQKAEGIIVETFDGHSARWAKWVAAHYQQPRGRDLRGEENIVR
jgi:hypothetical protein